MLGRTAIIALFASAATAATVATRASNNYGDGMFVFPLLGIYLMLSLVTYYTPGLGACGHSNTDTDYIVAVAHGTFDTYPYIMRCSLIPCKLTGVWFIVALQPTQTSRLIKT